MKLTREILARVTDGMRKLPEQQKPTVVIPQPRLNKLESDYARHLAVLQACGEIVTFAEMPNAIRLADRCTYTVDFVVVLPGGVVRFDEVKGAHATSSSHKFGDGIVKFKVCAEQTGLWFRMVTRQRGQWMTVREYNAPAAGGVRAAGGQRR